MRRASKFHGAHQWARKFHTCFPAGREHTPDGRGRQLPVGVRVLCAARTSEARVRCTRVVTNAKKEGGRGHLVVLVFERRRVAAASRCGPNPANAGWRRRPPFGGCDPEGAFSSDPAPSRVYSPAPCPSNTAFTVPVNSNSSPPTPIAGRPFSSRSPSALLCPEEPRTLGSRTALRPNESRPTDIMSITTAGEQSPTRKALEH